MHMKELISKVCVHLTISILIGSILNQGIQIGGDTSLPGRFYKEDIESK
jgi:hypothetical protein